VHSIPIAVPADVGVLRDFMLDGDDAKPTEARREQGAQAGRAWAATAPLEEKQQFQDVLPDPDVEHDSRCALIARTLKQALLDPGNEARWPTLYPLVESRGLTDAADAPDTWLEGFVDGALDVMGLNPAS
jgi:hypothetical protein